MLTLKDGVKPRRKPATYGKVSQNTFLAYNNTSLGATNQFNDGVVWPLRNEVDRVKDDGIGTAKSGRSLVKTKSKSVSQLPQKKSARQKREAASLPSGTLIDLNILHTDALSAAPPSDNEQDTMNSRQGDFASKKRKTNPGAAKDVHGLVYDDDSLQRHIAAEIDDYPHQVSGFAEQQLCGGIVIKQSASTSCSPPAKTKVPSLSKLSDRFRTVGTRNHVMTTSPVDHVRNVGSAGDLGGHDLHFQMTNPASISAQTSTKSRWQLPGREHVTKRSQAFLPSSEPVSHETSKENREKPSALAAMVPAASTKSSRTFSHLNQIKPKISRSDQCMVYAALPQHGTGHPSPDGSAIPSLQAVSGEGYALENSGMGDDDSKIKSKDSSSKLIARTKVVDKLNSWSSVRGLSKDEADKDKASSDKGKPDDLNSQVPSLTKTCLGDTPLGPASQGLSIGSHGVVSVSTSLSPPLRQIGGPKVTYARQRSYLTEDDVTEATVFSLPLVRGAESQDPSRRRGVINPLKLLNSQSLSEEAYEDDDPQCGPIRNIHELREAGGNARLIGEMEAILDDIEDKTVVPLALKRSGLLDLALRLQQPSFCRQFLDHGLEPRLLSHVDSSSDMIVNGLLAAALILVVKGPCSADVLSQLSDQRMVNFFSKLLDSNRDLIAMTRERKANMSKATQAGVRDFCNSLLLSSIWRAGRPSKLTVGVLALQYLDYLVRHAREVGCTSDFLTHVTVERLTDILAPPQSSSVAPEFHLAVSILESCTINSTATCQDQEALWSRASVGKVTQLLPLVETWSGESFGTLRALVLRLCLNLTNNNHTLSEAFSRPDVIGASVGIVESHFRCLSTAEAGDQQALLLDNLILSLGLLVNLAEWSQSARQLFIESHGHTDCLDILLQLFLTGLQRASEVTNLA